MRMRQQKLFPAQAKAHGGTLYRKRKGRGPRPLATRSTMHLVLRSSRAQGDWSFVAHKAKIQEITEHFCRKHAVRLSSLANVGNHLHLHLRLTNRRTYNAFIRALTAAIAMAVTGASRWKPLEEKFWDYRPFTRIVQGLRAYLNLRDYIQINQLEALGVNRRVAREYLNWRFVGNRS